MKILKTVLIAASLAAFALPAMATEGRTSDIAAARVGIGTNVTGLQNDLPTALSNGAAERSYAAREAAAKDLEKFAGGDGTAIYLSSGAAAVLLVIIVLLIVY